MDKRQLNRILWVFMVLIFIAVGLVLRGNLHRTTHITLPAENVTEDPGTQGPTAPGEALTVVEITPETVQAAIATLQRPQTYRRTVSVEQIWSGGNSVTEFSTAVLNGWTRIDYTRPDGQIRHTLTDGSTTYIWYNDEKKYFSGNAGEISADNEQRIPTYEDILELPAEAITAADYRDYEGINCIYVEIAEDPAGYALSYWVSVDSGLLVAAERMAEGVCVYRMSALTLDTILPTENDFVLPDETHIAA